VISRPAVVLAAGRCYKPTSSATFPVYHDLEASLAAAAARQEAPRDRRPHPRSRGRLAHSDAKTVSMMLARMGLQDNHCLKVEMSVDAMFIRSTAYLIQSSDGSVVTLLTEAPNRRTWSTG
jgi:hypothetical protein